MRTTTFLIATLVVLITIVNSADCQMVVSGDTIVGNEWIDYDKVYHKIRISEDGIYRIDGETLSAAGIDVNSSTVARLALWANGQELPIRVEQLSNDAVSFVEFYAEKNRGRLDSHLFAFEDTNNQLNPEVSMYTDTATYWLTLGDSEGLRMAYSDLDPSTTGLSMIPYCLYTEAVIFADFHYKPVHGSDRDYIRYSHFDVGEGFGKRIETVTATALAAEQLIASSSIPAQLSVRYASNNGASHVQKISFNGQQKDELIYNGYRVQDLSYTISHNELRATNSLVIEGHVTADKHVLASASLTYARRLHAAGQSSFEFELDPFSSVQRIEVEGFVGVEPLLYDLDAATRLRTEVVGGKVIAAIPAKGQRHRYLLIDGGAVNGAELRAETRFRDLGVLDPSFLFLASERFIGDASVALGEYVSYRESDVGGGYNVDVVSIDEVIDQFGYGVDHHGMAMKNFGHYIVNQYKDLEYLMIIGKGRSYQDVLTYADQSTNRSNLLVPTYGFPGSDNLITSLGNTPMARVPTGRLAVTTPEELSSYISKLKEYESAHLLPQTIGDKYWQKQVMHLSGGSSNGTEQSSIAAYLRDMERKVESNKMGADVTTFYKTSSDALQTSTSTSILNIINNGLRMLTFFGHSSQGSFDFSIEDPALYDNQGRYPLLISLGCFSGDIHTETGSLSEDFVNEPNRGAIAFMAASGTAYLDRQGNFGNRFYELLGGELYGSSLGKLLQRVASENNTVATNDFAVRTMFQQFTIHGDPSLRLNYETGPDYVIDYASVSTDPSIITTSGDIKISMDVLNLGQYSTDTSKLELEVVHYLPNGTIADTIAVTLDRPASRSTATVTIQNPGITGVGRNRIVALLDPDNEIAELPDPAAEQNNQLSRGLGADEFEFFILDNSLRPIYPEKYGIVNNADFSFSASTSNVFQEEGTYLFELDTTQNYDSPALVQLSVTTTGGTVEFDPGVAWEAERVYYWRVSPVASTTVTGDLVWQEASFVYLPGSSGGWNQSHYYQYLDAGEGTTMQIDENRQFKLRQDENYVRIKNNTRGFEGSGNTRPQYFGNTFGEWSNMWVWQVSPARQGIQVAVLREDRGYWQVPPGGRAGSVNSKSTFINIHTFTTDTPAERKLLIDFLSDTIPENYYVIMYSAQWSPTNTYTPEEWEGDKDIYGRSLFDVLEDAGVSGTRILAERGSVPFIFMYQQGTGEVYRNVIAQSVDEEIEAQWEFPRVGQEGKYISPMIGPATTWNRLSWVEDLLGRDSTMVIIKGYSDEQDQVRYIDTVRLDYDVDISSIDAGEYPYMQLELQSFDPDRSAAQLGYWRVLYEGAPEATILVDEFHADTLDRGEDLRFRYRVKNTSSFDMDSVLVRYSIVDASNNRYVQEERSLPLESEDAVDLTYIYNTKDITGDQLFSVEINPDDDQVESHTFNNIGIRRFHVRADGVNPELDVTFDGLRIMNGDYVSAEPEIVIYLRDDNTYLRLDDPSLYELRLDTLRSSGPSTTIDMSDPRVVFEGAGASADNEARLIFSPSLPNGEYRLYVQGQDASGNFSGVNNRAVEFRVETESKISNVLNYPNPFSTSTQFVFMVTGSRVPDNMAIQIMTMSGKVVKEISKEELGPLQIGMNRTSYKWDGTDEYGSRLANGVYLYRVLSDMEDGEEIKQFGTEADRFFTEGFGKMVIMR